MRGAVFLLLLLGSAGCKQPQQVAVAATADANSAASDVVSFEVSRPIDVAQDASETANGDTFVASEVAAADAAAETTGTVWGFQPCVVGLIPNLPLPNHACTKSGERRCTDHLASNGGSSEAISNYCRRPNFVECMKAPDGTLRWALKSCDAEAKAKASLDTLQGCQVTMMCVEFPAGPKCVNEYNGPYYNTPGPRQDQPAPGYMHCRPELLNTQLCYHGLAQCQEFKNGAYHGSVPRIPPSKPGGYEKCGTFAEGGTYWVVVKQCGDLQFSNCGEPFATVKGRCDLYPDGYRCTKTCDEALASWNKAKK